MAMRKDSEARAADIDTPTIGPLHTMTLNWVPQGEAAVICEPWERKQAPDNGHAARWSL